MQPAATWSDLAAAVATHSAGLAQHPSGRQSTVVTKPQAALRPSPGRPLPAGLLVGVLTAVAVFLTVVGVVVFATWPGEPERQVSHKPRDGEPTRPGDDGPRDNGPRDDGPRDTGPRDTGPRDTGPRDDGPLINKATLIPARPEKAPNAAQTNEIGQWVSLFNGQNLGGWRIWAPVNSRESGQAFTISNPDTAGSAFFANYRDTAALCLDGMFANYRLQLEVLLLDESADLGVLYHCTGDFGTSGWNVTPNRYFEFNLAAKDAGFLLCHWDRSGRDALGRLSGSAGESGRGGFRLLGTAQPHRLQPGRWHRIELICRGDTAEYVIDGVKVLELRELRETLPGQPPRPMTFGQIQLHHSGGPAYIRHLRIAAEPTLTNSVGMAFNAIPAGTFPRNGVPVDVTGAFLLGATEVTQRQFQSVMGRNPSYFSAGGQGAANIRGMDMSNFPVESVTYAEAEEFCRRLSELPAERAAGRTYRLPTADEWELACRAGTATAYWFGDSPDAAKANFFRRGDNGTRPVRSYPPNGLGPFDMHGNFWEFCSARFSEPPVGSSPMPKPPNAEQMIVLRGGAWDSPDHEGTSGFWRAFPLEGRGHASGFRVVCDLAVAGP